MSQLVDSPDTREDSREEWETDFRVKRKSWLRLKHLLWFLLVVMGLIAVFTPYVKRQRYRMDMNQAMNNMRPIGLVMQDFAQDYGHFPDDVTATESSDLREFRGEYSNRYLGQLIAAGYTSSEEIFFARDARGGNQRADNVISPPSRILEKGECGFSYVMKQDGDRKLSLSPGDKGELPLLLAPLVDRWGTFEKNSYAGYGVYLRVDGAARAESLDPSDQKIRFEGGSALFDAGPGTMWGDMKPIVLLPER